VLPRSTELELAQRELRIKRAALDASISGVAVWRLDGRISYVNPAFLAMWGYDNALEAVGKSLSELFDDDRAEAMKQTVEAKGGWVGKLQARRWDGSRFAVLASASLIEDDGGQPAGGVAHLLDMTHRERLTRKAFEQTERLRTLHEVERSILGAGSPEEIALTALHHVCQTTGCERAAVSVVDLEKNRGRVLATVAEGTGPVEAGTACSLEGFEDVITSLTAGHIAVVEDVRQRPLPEEIRERVEDCPPWSSVLVPLRSAEELIGCVSLTTEKARAFARYPDPAVEQIADAVAVAIKNARLLESVREQAARLRSLATRLRESEEGERRRLARDLHDCVGESLTALSINLNVIQAQLDREAAPSAHARLDDSLQLVATVAERVRRVIADLRPPILDEKGLYEALCRFAEDFALRTGVGVSVQGRRLSERAPSSVEDALFRIGQEALNNVAKHAEAKQVTIELLERDEGIRLAVRDDGRGFDPEARAAPEGRDCYGLRTMAERAEAVGGRCWVESRPEEGTRVIAEIPR
jgi:PAS domain S-box-containing protein